MREELRQIENLVATLPHGPLVPQHQREVVEPIYERLMQRAAFPLELLHSLDEDTSNPAFHLDVDTSPAQVVLAKSRFWSFRMYVWLPQSDAAAHRMAHNHTAVGVSLIHTGCCYEERVYAYKSARWEEEGTHTCIPGEVRVILPATMHSVRPIGGFSFNLWGPATTAKTVVIDLSTGQTTQEPTEFADKVETLITSVRKAGLLP